MNQNCSALHLPVFTITGQYLGRVVDIELTPQGDQVVNFCVRPPFSVTRLWQKILLINVRQVVSFTKECIVVDGNNIKLPTTASVGLATELPVG